jgi:hypothetical protein
METPGLQGNQGLGDNFSARRHRPRQVTAPRNKKPAPDGQPGTGLY